MCTASPGHWIGTTVVRALESAANADGLVRAGDGVARNRIGSETQLGVVRAILTGIHLPGESHFELLRAFADEPMLNRITAAAIDSGYRAHKFGDTILIERQPYLDTVHPDLFRAFDAKGAPYVGGVGADKRGARFN